MYDGTNVVLVFDDSSSLTNRYLHGDLVDQIFADETATEVLWSLTDNQGTVRDVANYDPTLDTSSVLNHCKFDAYGNITAESNGSIEFAYAWTGRYFDEDTALQYNRARWYDARTARWMSIDPIHPRPDTNGYRYTWNSPTNFTDPSGMDRPLDPPATAEVPFAVPAAWNHGRPETIIGSHQKGWSYWIGGNNGDTYDKAALKAFSASAGYLDSLSFNQFSRFQQFAADGQIRYDKNFYGGGHITGDVLQMGVGAQGVAKGLTVIRTGGGAPLLVGGVSLGKGAPAAVVLTGQGTAAGVLGVKGIFSAYSVFGSGEFGNQIHSNFESYLHDQYPNTKFKMRTDPGKTGVDASVTGRVNPGFKHAELKPFSQSGYTSFISQLGNWKLKDVMLFFYDEMGRIFPFGLF